MKKHVLLFLLWYAAAATLFAQNDIHIRTLSLSPRKLAWYQHRGIDLSKYDFSNKEYNRLIHRTRWQAMGANISATFGAGFAISGLYLLLSKTPSEPFFPPILSKPVPIAERRMQRRVWGALQIGFAVPLFAITDASNRQYKKKIATLQGLFPMTVEK